jgi:Mrp family chromosome partitioning ATPase
MFGVKDRMTGDENGINTVLSPSGMQMVSMNLLLDEETSPVIWRGMVISGTVMQFWTDVIWKDVDLLFIDMPPGTGDVPLTVFQSLPLAGIVIVTSPQELVSMIVEKAVRMAQLMNIPVLGIVENYSYLKCPDCGKEISVFGESHVEEVAKQYGLEVLARVPIDPALANLCDKGALELMECDAMEHAADVLEEKLG